LVDALIAGTVLALALLPVATGRAAWPPRLRGIAILLPPLAFLGVVVAGHLLGPRVIEERDVAHRPIEIQAEGFVTSRTCEACHPRPHATWHASYHRTMTRAASGSTIAADDEATRFEYVHEYAWMRQGDQVWVASDDPAWAAEGAMPHDASTPGIVQRPVVLVTGSHHEQVYWFSTGETRELRAFPFIFRIEEKRWLPWSAAFMMPDSLSTGLKAADWNDGCIYCHTTDPRPGIWGPSEVDSKVSEWGIACEACHGPAEEHVRANASPTRRYRLHLGGESDPTIVNPARLSARLSTDVCGSCHSVHTGHTLAQIEAARVGGFGFRPGDELEKTRNIVRTEEENRSPATRGLLEERPDYLEAHFWPDGVIIVNGREYNAVTRSPCFAGAEFSCLSCHQLHQQDDDPRPLAAWAEDQLAVGMEGDEACLQCHESFRETVTEHTHHPIDSDGSRCYNCHMPNTVYGLLKASRDHQVRSPSAHETLDAGRPNACNLCHLDRTLAWSARHLEAWYGIPAPDLTDPEHERTAEGALMLLRGHAAQRGLVAWHMGWEPARAASGEDWIAPLLAPLLEDPYAAVRQIARRSVGSLPGYAELGLDPMASAKERTRAKWQVWEIWEKRRPPVSRNAAAEVLLDENGQRQVSRMEHLLEQRDDRIVRLEE
jgi:hypothetical protein